MSGGDSTESVELELVGVDVEAPANVPVMHLREQEGARRILSIYIGMSEANAIRLAQTGAMPPRPLTHDLLVNVLEDLGAHLNRIVITEVRDNTYFAELQLVHQGQRHSISCRPSDAVAVAVRAAVPIAASRELLDQVGLLVDDEGEQADEEVIDEFRDFIENINPEDFRES